MQHLRPPGYPPIADYGLVGDCHTAALVGRHGSIDWLAAPDFDSPSIFARLLDAERGGHFAIYPSAAFDSDVAYVGFSGVLRTTFRTARGVATLTDFMPICRGESARPVAEPRADRRLVRLVEGVAGEVELAIELDPRPAYAARAARLETQPGGFTIVIADGVSLRFYSSVPLATNGTSAQARYTLRTGERLAFFLDLESGLPLPPQGELFGATEALEATFRFWSEWAAGCRYSGPYHDIAMRSMVTLKLLTYAPTGGMVAAPTTSLPEQLGGVRNWDYRYTWIRDASFAFYALLAAGHIEDVQRFMEWVCEIAMRCQPGQLQIMYGLRGERELAERTLEHLDGYRGSRPVRIGNAASTQFQLDVYGELLDCFHAIRRSGDFSEEAIRHPWPVFSRQVDAVASAWQRPDSGIWEVRSAPQHFVYSKVMAWVALDRGIKAGEEMRLPGDLAHWRVQRDAIKRDVLRHGYDRRVGAFTQAYGSPALDAANLLLPLVGFIPASDPRMQATIDAIRTRLLANGLVYRYRDTDDGLPGTEATFAVCTFWLVENLAALGRIDEARALFETMLARATPLGLYAEELDPGSGAHVGNFPQAFSHLGLVNAAVSLVRAADRARARQR